MTSSTRRVDDVQPDSGDLSDLQGMAQRLPAEEREQWGSGATPRPAADVERQSAESFPASDAPSSWTGPDPTADR